MSETLDKENDTYRLGYTLAIHLTTHAVRDDCQHPPILEACIHGKSIMDHQSVRQCEVCAGHVGGAVSDVDDYDTHWSVLGGQLYRIILFNIFGTFVGVEQTCQLRLNYWLLHLLEQAVSLHYLCRSRFHKLTTNSRKSSSPLSS